jgi:hypothetical protein
MKKNEEPGATMTRRGLLGCAGKLAVGSVALAAGGGPGLLASAQAKATPAPWPYKKLDPEEVGEITYGQWYSGFCMNAVLTGLLEPLRRSVGEPYASFPLESFVWGHGGVVGWGTMCGTLLGATMATNLVCGQGVAKDGEQVANEVIHYYASTELPTYAPRTPKLAAVPPTSNANSPLCHLSVGKWMKKADRGFFSPERKDRCARLAANVAMQTARHLNDWSEGKFKAQHRLPALAYDITAQHNCIECHRDAVPRPNLSGNPPPKKT